jgi:nucleoside-diphosphate-sugar epimerase
MSGHVLVTGALGRVATALVPALDTRYALRLLDRDGGSAGASGGSVVVGDVQDHRVLDEALEGVDAVVHLAANPNPDAIWADLREPNVEGFVALLEAADRHGVCHVVFASSVHAMGAHEGAGHWPVDAAWPPGPCCPYGATKAFNEALARVYAYRSSMSLIGLRFGLCTPRARPDEREAGWTRPVDLGRVVVAALQSDVHFGVYNALSWPSRHRWRIDATMDELGYRPERDVDDEPDTPSPDTHPAGAHLSTCIPGPDTRSSQPAATPMR